jgi:hypothetical protein
MQNKVSLIPVLESQNQRLCVADIIPDNTPETPYRVKLNVNDISGIRLRLLDNASKYVYLDLSDSAITSIGEEAFYLCSTLTGIIIPNSVTSIGRSAFYGCFELTGITIPNNVTTIGQGAFGYTGLIGVTIPDSVIGIGSYAFEKCTKLTGVTIPNSVTRIENNTFENCYSLAIVTIGNGVTGIGRSAFYGCESLTSVMFQGTIPSSGFDNNSYNPPFPGNLRDKFYATDSTNGTPGTYTRPNGKSNKWTKQP